MPHNIEIARRGEQLAADHLTALGFLLLDRNWRYRCEGLRGELDLVAQDGGVLVAVEVKTRTSRRAGLPAEAVTAAKLAQLQRLAQGYRREHLLGSIRGLRVDVISVELFGANQPRITHLRGVQ